MLKGSNDLSLLVNLQTKYQTFYNRTLYGAWSSSLPVPDVGNEFSFFGNSFIIVEFKIDFAKLGLFMLSHVLIPPKQAVVLLPFCGPLYCWSDYLNIIKYNRNISMYNTRMNNYASIRRTCIYMVIHALMETLQGS